MFKFGYFERLHLLSGSKITFLYKNDGLSCGQGNFSIYPNIKQRQSKQCVYNGPGIRENAARIVDKFVKKQYHRAFKANAAASGAIATEVKANATALGANAKEVGVNATAPAANAKEVKANDKLPAANAKEV